MKTLIIGAGPAGLNAALYAVSEDNEVIVIDKNEKAGRKLYITGKGRCNVTNNSSVNDLIKNVVTNPKFLYSSFNFFNAQDTISFFNNNGCELVCERGNRVFPKSYHASDITKCLVEACEKKGVKFSYGDKANKITLVDGKFEVIASYNKYLVDNIVIATGGVSYPGTGSTGDGYKYAKQFGHTIVEPVPGLCALKLKDNIPYALNKMLFKNVTLTVRDGKWSHSEFGDLMFDHNTLDGPISLTISSLINRNLKDTISLEIDLKSALSAEQLDQRLIREINQNGDRNLYNFLKLMLPSEFINMFLEKCGLDSYKKSGELSQVERKKIGAYLKHFPLEYDGLSDIKQAIITSGGVNVKEINPNTMESKLVPHLYFAGEVVDVDAFTGGFNIQSALSMGALAGNSIKNNK